MTGVTSVSVGKYLIGRDDYDSDPRLISSLRLEADAASAVVGAVARLRIGSGPNDPRQCLPDVSYAEEIVVLFVTSEQGQSEIYLRYSGCDHHGFDDGVRTRQLTAHSITPFLSGPDSVTGSLSSGMARLVWRSRSREAD